MEVGAVKQAFNNEIILLKNNLNQAKIQTIHKLTRKAKTLAEKKAPEPLKEKLKRKAESAVKEVLIIKKIKPRDIARFIVTHTGKLNDFLNKPTVDNDKACARLLLHKALQDKYKLIRGKFSNISIKDLFMSRQERLKLKKEAKEKQKNKKKAKQNKNLQTVNVEGEWDVEMTDTSAEKNSNTNNDISDNDNEDNVSVNENDDIESEANDSGNENNSEDEKDDDDIESDQSNAIEYETNNTPIENEISDTDESDSKEIVHTKIATINNVKNKPLKAEKKKNKHKEKNKNLNEKMQKRNFNNKSEEVSTNAVKIVDPFFKTSSGENYMSLVEPRQPDEVKEVHKEGNRKYRRAVMFGHVPKTKPKKRNFEPKNEKKQDNVTNNKKNRSNQNNFKTVVSKEVPEKLHPSWEAKKKQSAILPFKGKKIVFDES